MGKTDLETAQSPLSIRERIIVTLVIFIIQMLKPWEYDHQFTKFWDEIKSQIKQ